MDLSGIIFVVLAVAWAGYLIPKALRHHDEVSRTRSVERSSDSARVLARRSPDRRGSRLEAARRTRSGSPVPAAVPAAAPARETPREVAPTAAQRPAAQPRARRARPTGSAARRRRRLLAVLLLALIGTGAAGYLGYAPWWTLAVPAVMTLAFLVLSCGAARRRRLSTRSARVPARATVAAPSPAAVPAPVAAPEPAQPVAAAAVVDRPSVATLPEPRTALVEHVDVDLADPGPPVVPSVGGTLWDPVPLTLPTYITKPTARRTVRTIDLGEPGTWTSGRTAEDAEIAARAAAARIPQQRSEEAGQRVANS